MSLIPERWETYRYGLVEISKGAALRRFRQSIKDHWGCCAYCGCNKDHRGASIHLTIDHVRPKSFGGSSFRTNLVPACLPCNSAKGSNRDWLVWYESQSFYCPEKAARIKAWITPLNNDLFDLWCLSGANHHEPRSDDGAVIHASQDGTRSEGLFERGFNRGAFGLLGGQVQAEASLSCC